MSRLAAIVLVSAAALAAAQPPAPGPAEIGSLVEKLGNDEYSEREAASKRLDAIGEPALDALRTALRSDKPEVVRRARDLIRAIERRIENKKDLAPTLVELTAKDRRLDDVLADLSKQTGWDVVLGGSKLGPVADRRITISTNGKVPFWSAVLAICKAAEVRVASSGWFLAPGASPYHGHAPEGVRVTRNTKNAVVLQANDAGGPRPATVFGAVMVEAVEFPPQLPPRTPSIILQVWPEPGFNWMTVRDVSARESIGSTGARLAADTSPVRPPTPAPNEGYIEFRNPNGTRTLVRDPNPPPKIRDQFYPDSLQAVVRFADLPERTTDLRLFRGTVLGTICSPAEPLAVVSKLVADKPSAAAGKGDVHLTVEYRKKSDGKLAATATVEYERDVVYPVFGAPVKLDAKPGRAVGSHTVHGVRITDANGRPYSLVTTGGESELVGKNHRKMTLKLELHPDTNGQGPPAEASFWATRVKYVEVPVLLKDVPISRLK